MIKCQTTLKTYPMCDHLHSSSFPSDSSGKFGSAGDSTSSPVPSSVAQQTQQQQQPTPFNALASTFAAAAPQQHPTLPPGYAYFYGGVGGMGAQLVSFRMILDQVFSPRHAGRSSIWTRPTSGCRIPSDPSWHPGPYRGRTDQHYSVSETGVRI